MKKVVLLSMLLIAASAFGGSTVYTDLSAWGTAVGSYNTFSTSGGTWTGSGLSVTTPNSSGFGAPGSVGNSCSSACVFSGTVWEEYLGGSPSTWTFATPQTSFGALWDLQGPGGPGYSINLNIYLGGELVGTIPSATNGTFWGFTSDTPFTYFTLSSDSETYDISTVYTAAPEPASVLLFISGASVLGFWRRKK